MDVTLHLQAIVTLLALINPAMCAAIFSKAAAGQSRNAQLKLTVQGALTVLVILMLAAVFGAKVLHAFGVSLDAFSVAGGGVLVWIGISMLGSSAAASPDTNSSGASTLNPLIMFAASPGTITGVITLAVAHSRMALPVTALVAVGVATLVMWIVLVLSVFAGSKKSGGSFLRDTVTRLMGLIVIAMGVQFALTGIHGFFASPVG